VRHRAPSVPARIELTAEGFVASLESPVWAPAPGQAAVIYDAADEQVLGGGWITAAA
jgi:tRNA U34 2-thiouridine synthase MnmA/TrmU